MAINCCEVCGKEFSGRWGAKTCSTACRVKKSRHIKSGEGRGWYAVRYEYQSEYARLVPIIGNRAAETIEHTLKYHGAAAAEYAIAAVSEAIANMADSQQQRAS